MRTIPKLLEPRAIYRAVKRVCPVSEVHFRFACFFQIEAMTVARAGTSPRPSRRTAHALARMARVACAAHASTSDPVAVPEVAALLEGLVGRVVRVWHVGPRRVRWAIPNRAVRPRKPRLNARGMTHEATKESKSTSKYRRVIAAILLQANYALTRRNICTR